METEYIYLIIVLVLLAVLALAAILRYRKSKVSIKGPGVSLDIEGETGEEKTPMPTEQVTSAKTKIGGKVVGSKVITHASKGNAETNIGEDVEESNIRTEN
jgi:hypothetical protein